MNLATCSFQKEVSYALAKHSFCCQRQIYQDGVCIFHLNKHLDPNQDPKMQKEIYDAFQDALHADIKNAKLAGIDHEIDWRGAHFPPLRLEGVTFPRKVLLATAKFERSFDMINCVFESGFDASKGEFMGGGKNVTFEGCKFLGDASFWAAAFGKDPVIKNCRFDKNVKFQMCKLDSPDFSSNRFLGGVQFPMATFSGVCDFKFSHFESEAFFLGMLVNKDAVFDFRFCHFSGELLFGADASSREVLSCSDLDFSMDVTVAEKSTLKFQKMHFSTATFRHLILSDGVTLQFEDMDFEKADFCYIQQREKVAVGFVNSRLTNATFLNTNIEKFRFDNVTWHEIDDRKGLISEIALRDEISLLIHDRKLSGDELRRLLDKVEWNSANYRQLVKNQEERRNFASAEDFHVGEMEMQRQKGTIRGAKYLGLLRTLTSWNDFSVYRALSKYGTSYLHSLKVLGIMVLFLALLFLFSGIENVECVKRLPALSNTCRIEVSILPNSANRFVGPVEWIGDYIPAVLLTLGVATLQKETLYKTTSNSGEFLRIITILLVPGQAAITLLAIRRRFKRGGGGE